MRGSLSLLLALAAAVLPQDSKPERPPLPTEIRLGDSVTLPLARIGAEGHALRLELSVAEPLTILAESYDADVTVAVEDASGAVVASDDESGTETNAHLVWTPEAPGPYAVRIALKQEATGSVTMRALRSAVARGQREPALAARAYWEISYGRARARGDGQRSTLALAEYARRSGDASARETLEGLRNAVLEIQSLLDRANAAAARGDAAASRSDLRKAWESLRAIPEGSSSGLLASIAWDLSEAASEASDPRVQGAGAEWACAFLERTLPEDHPELLTARGGSGWALFVRGELVRARSLLERVLGSLERTLPETHVDLLGARYRFALTLEAAGDLEGARDLFERVVDVSERVLPPDGPNLLAARSGLAGVMFLMGDLDRARNLQEQVLAAHERAEPKDGAALQSARTSFASTLLAQGDLVRASALFAQVLQSLEGVVPEDHPYLAVARENLAISLASQGDFDRARVIQERVLETREATLPEDHPDLVGARSNLAVTMRRQGDLAGAREIEERVLETVERTLPSDHPHLLGARGNHASTLKALGDLSGARALEDLVLESRERTRPEDHPEVVAARQNLAVTLRMQGDLVLARAIGERIVAARERSLASDHPDLLLARTELAVTLGSLGAVEEMVAMLGRVAAGALQQLRRGAILSPREMRVMASAQENSLCATLSLVPRASATDPTAREPFRWIETRRALAAAQGVAGPSVRDAEIESLTAAVRSARARSGDLVSGISVGASSSRPTAAAIAASSHERDSAERALVQALARHGWQPLEIDADRVRTALVSGEAVVAYHRYHRREIEPGASGGDATTPSVLAHVVLPDGTLHRVELGPQEAFAKAVTRWREAIGAPVVRGVGGIAADRDALRELGARVRKIVLDPILAVTGAATRIHVCLEGETQLIPLEALPLGEGVVGDRYAIRHEVSLARLLRPGLQGLAEPRLVALGGIDFDAEGAGEALSADAPPVALRRSGPGGAIFGPLRQTRYEVEGIEDLFEKSWKDGTRLVLTKDAATKAAFAAAAPSARFLHLATHGYFSDANVKVLGEPDRDASHALWRRSTLEETVKGLSPFTLCGLALAGANRGMDSLGRVPGILTAEELMGLDLRHCELAVLSACETHVGLDRGASGIASLQAALHAAGVRTAITSLWKVDDERTRELMVDFYRRLWVEKRPVAAALWEAKKAARAKGWPLRDWSGWILTGDPGDDPQRAPETPR